MLKRKENQITEIATKCGFGSSAHFSSCFQKHVGLTLRNTERNTTISIFLKKFGCILEEEIAKLVYNYYQENIRILRGIKALWNIKRQLKKI